MQSVSSWAFAELGRRYKLAGWSGRLLIIDENLIITLGRPSWYQSWVVLTISGHTNTGTDRGSSRRSKLCQKIQTRRSRGKAKSTRSRLRWWSSSRRRSQKHQPRDEHPQEKKPGVRDVHRRGPGGSTSRNDHWYSSVTCASRCWSHQPAWGRTTCPWLAWRRKPIFSKTRSENFAGFRVVQKNRFRFVVLHFTNSVTF